MRWLVPEPLGPVEPLAAPPSFSVVIPAYQAAATVARAVDSALSQTAAAHEVIVVDDGSTDGSADVLEQFSGRITLIRQENAGAPAARNRANAQAGGEFVVTLDADDAFDPRRLEELGELARARPDLDLITTDARFVVDGQLQGTFLEHNPFAVAGQRTAIFASCFVGGWPAVRRERLAAIGGFDPAMRIAYDWDCWLRLLLAGVLAGLVAEPLYEYTVREGSLSADRVPSLWERVKLLQKARSNPDLRPADRPPLARALRAHRTRAAEAELAAGAGRSRSVHLAAMPGIAPRTRARAALAALTGVGG